MNNQTNLSGLLLYLIRVFPSHPWESLFGFTVLLALGIMAIMVVLTPLLLFGSVLSSLFLMLAAGFQIILKSIRKVSKSIYRRKKYAGRTR
jgi:hypothetical protein